MLCNVLQEDEVLHADARGMVMMNLYLYMTLPNLMPRTTLEFAGKLGEKRVRSSLHHAQMWVLR